MKQVVRYSTTIVLGKLRLVISITIDDRGFEYVSEKDGVKSTNLSLQPYLNLNIIRMGEMGDDGRRARVPWNPNDSLVMTKMNMPVLLNELKTIQQGLKITELYTYQGQRLELNEEVASKIRRVFMIGQTTLELSAVVVVQPDSTGEDVRMEGIKVKFNNEQSSVMLTLNELESLTFNLEHLPVDIISFMMYTNFITKPGNPRNFDQNSIKVDIPPITEVL